MYLWNSVLPFYCFFPSHMSGKAFRVQAHWSTQLCVNSNPCLQASLAGRSKQTSGLGQRHFVLSDVVLSSGKAERHKNSNAWERTKNFENRYWRWTVLCISIWTWIFLFVTFHWDVILQKNCKSSTWDTCDSSVFTYAFHFSHCIFSMPFLSLFLLSVSLLFSPNTYIF